MNALPSSSRTVLSAFSGSIRSRAAIASKSSLLRRPVARHLLQPPLASHSFSRSLHSTRHRCNVENPPKGTPIGQIDARLSLTFTCTVPDCGHRSTHEFSKRSYERGIVLVQCPGCKNRHLIADHLSWFTQTASEPKTVEEMVREKGGRIRTGRKVFGDGGEDQGETIEILSDSEEGVPAVEEGEKKQ